MLPFFFPDALLSQAVRVPQHTYSEMESYVQEVYWKVLLGPTLVEGREGRNPYGQRGS